MSDLTERLRNPTRITSGTFSVLEFDSTTFTMSEAADTIESLQRQCQELRLRVSTLYESKQERERRIDAARPHVDALAKALAPTEPTEESAR